MTKVAEDVHSEHSAFLFFSLSSSIDSVYMKRNDLNNISIEKPFSFAENKIAGRWHRTIGYNSHKHAMM